MGCPTPTLGRFSGAARAPLPGAFTRPDADSASTCRLAATETTMSDQPVRLSASAEALLGTTPFPERDDWETMAALIDERVRETEAKSSAPLWLMAPLPDEAHEPGAIASAAGAVSGSDAEASGEAVQV